MVAKVREIGADRQWIKPTEWRRLTGMPHTTMYELIREGEIHTVKVGERFYIPITELNDFFARHAERAA